MKKKADELFDELPDESSDESAPSEIPTNSRGKLELSPEEEFASYLEEAKERLENLIQKNPSIVMPDEEEILKTIVLRVKRGYRAAELARVLHRDARVVYTIIKGIPARKDPSFPLQPWEAELASNMAGIPPPKLMQPTQEIVQGELRKLRANQGSLETVKRFMNQPPSYSGPYQALMLAFQLQPETMARLMALAMMSGAHDVDIWINQNLLPWYLMKEKIKEKLHLDKDLTPDEWFQLIDTIVTQNAGFIKVFMDLQQVMSVIAPQQGVVKK